MRVFSQINHERRWSDLNAKLFQTTAQEFYEALRLAMPGVSPDLLARGFLYAIFVFLGVIQENAKLRGLNHNTYSPADLTKVYRSVLPFVAGGIRALAIVDWLSAATQIDDTAVFP
jgi:hypothetical protein